MSDERSVRHSSFVSIWARSSTFQSLEEHFKSDRGRSQHVERYSQDAFDQDLSSSHFGPARTPKSDYPVSSTYRRPVGAARELHLTRMQGTRVVSIGGTSCFISEVPERQSLTNS